MNPFYKTACPCDKPPYICPYGAKEYKQCKLLCGRGENTIMLNDLLLEQMEQM